MTRTDLLAACSGYMLFNTPILKLSMQKDQFGQPIILRAKYIVCAAGYEFKFAAILGAPVIHTEGNTQTPNPLYGRGIEVIADPTLNALAGENDCPWFLFADKADATTIQVDYLNGQEIPTIRRSEKAGQLGFIWDIYLDWGINVLDWRGAIKNPGAPIVIEE